MAASVWITSGIIYWLDAPVRFTQGEDGRFLTNLYNVGSTFWLMATHTN
jgi:hypothetical protein